jgi:hypothetical protein
MNRERIVVTAAAAFLLLGWGGGRCGSGRWGCPGHAEFIRLRFHLSERGLYQRGLRRSVVSGHAAAIALAGFAVLWVTLPLLMRRFG